MSKTTAAPGRAFLTADEAISVLPAGEYVHVFISSGMLLGTDWRRADVEKLIREADIVEIAGDVARAMDHGLCVYPGGAKYVRDLRFVATDPDRLDAVERAKSEELRS